MKRWVVSSIGMILLLALPAAAQNTPTPAPAPAGIVLPELFNRAGDRLDAGDMRGAALDFSLFLALNPLYSQAYYGRAFTALAESDYEAALADLNHAVDTAQDAAPAYRATLFNLRGRAQQALGALDAALSDFSQAIALDPTGQHYADRALAHAAADQPQAAIDDLDVAISLLPDEAVLPLLQAGQYERLGDASSAAAAMLRYLQIIGADVRDAGTLTSGEPQFVDITPGVIFAFSFDGQGGQRLDALAQARPGDALDPLLLLLDPDGAPLAGSDDESADSLNARLSDVLLPADGVYTLLLSHALGGDQGAAGVAIQLSGS